MVKRSQVFGEASMEAGAWALFCYLDRAVLRPERAGTLGKPWSLQLTSWLDPVGELDAVQRRGRSPRRAWVTSAGRLAPVGDLGVV